MYLAECTSDGYPALRTLLGAKSKKRVHRSWRRRRANSSIPAQPAGRWTLLRSSLMSTVLAEQRTEEWCRLLLRRYGVVFRDLLAREAAPPPWRELLRVYRALEARGAIRCPELTLHHSVILLGFSISLRFIG